MTNGTIATEDYPRGWRRFVYATNHKDVGTMFLVFALIAAVLGGMAGHDMQRELAAPGLQQFHDMRAFAVAATTHGIVMLFFALLPAALGFAHWLVPLMIGSPGLAFPRLGGFAFWLMPFALLMFLLSLDLPGDADGMGVATGWQMIAPLSSYGAPGPAVDCAMAALVMAAAGLAMAAINLIVTIFNMRAPGMSLRKMPLLPWASLTSSFLLLVILPVLALVYVMLAMDRHVGTTFFNPAGGGDVLLYQHLFWFFGHAAALVALIIATGIVGHVIAAFSARPLPARLGLAYALIALALTGLCGWGQHMISAGMSFEARAFFLVATLAAVVPMGFIVFSLLATLSGGAVRLTAPMLWALGFVPVFTVGAMSAMVQAGGAGVLLHGTVFEIAQWHYQFALSALFAFFAGWYFWFPKMTGWRCNGLLAGLHFAVTFVGANLAVFPQFLLGLSGMPRGVADYPAVYTGWNHLAAQGGEILLLGQLIFVVAVALSLWLRRPAGNNPWNLDEGLEWTLSSPPPYQTFNELPQIR